MKDFLLFSGSSNRPLAEAVAKELGITLGNVDLTRFADGELRPWIQEDVRDKTVFVLESLSYPMDEHVMELSLIGDAIRRSAPKTMIAVIPYMGYSRQDKQHRVGEPVSARVIAKFIEVSKFKEIITIDLHNDAIVGFFQIPVTHVSVLEMFAQEIKKLNLPHGVIVSPDVGGVKRARNLAYLLDMPMVVMEKKRFLDRQDSTEAVRIIGEVKGMNAIVIDDMIASGSTIAGGAPALKEAGALSVTFAATHGVLAGPAVERLKAEAIDRVILTDTIAVPQEKRFDKLTMVSVAPLLARAISSLVK